MGNVISLATFKTYQAISATTDDVRISMLLAAVSRAMARHIGCELAWAAYSWELDGNGHASIYLPAWPITKLVTLTEDDVALTEGDGEDFRLDYARGRIEKFSSGYWSPGVKNIAVSAEAGYDQTKVITAFANHAGTVPGTVKATCTGHGLPAGTSDIEILGTTNYNGVRTVTYVDANSFYFTATWVATETGTLVYPTMPEDLKHVALIKASKMLKEAVSRNWGETSRNIAGGSVTIIEPVLWSKEEKDIMWPYKRKLL